MVEVGKLVVSTLVLQSPGQVQKHLDRRLRLSPRIPKYSWQPDQVILRLPGSGIFCQEKYLRAC